MNAYGEGLPAYRTIRMTVQDGPIAAFADEEAWRARERYPTIVGMGLPVFVAATESERGGWEILGSAGDTPQSVRDSLGSHFRRLANEAAEAGRAGDRKKYRAAYEKLDRVAVDELRVLGTRYRVVRVEQFIRLGPDGPEPPRPSDPDPGEVGEAHRLPSRIKGFVIDPYIGTGMAEGLLKFDLMQFVLKAGTAPPDVRGDSLRAVETHPGGVLLPAEFAIAECGGDGQWKPHSGAAPSPQAARDRLAVDFRVMTPIRQRLSEAEREEYARAADRLDEKRGAGIAVAGRRYRVARVEQLVRIGPDGPEGPRPSDFDPDPPIEAHARQLSEQDRLGDEPEDEDASLELNEEVREIRRLMEKEEARRAAWKLQREKGKRAAKPPEPGRESGPGPEPDNPWGVSGM
ncbi:hypothetical protein SSPS47_21505 [Streptomyces sp. S4.7]|uniref:DUF5954 family protein n=1 Tax=Streptomyces sp. S4.7 TaxID=2705439 RepID=UPI0013994324|nr:DUF5954 family protein [Streptomyces sp. S4.7]QHY97686.1 hypothetical protein SSPS47_21505 [Streptomyces sp. S4.7]